MYSVEADPSKRLLVISAAGQVTKKEVAAVVRVVPDPHKDIGLNILSQFHYGPNIKLVTVESLAAALSMLMEEA